MRSVKFQLFAIEACALLLLLGMSVLSFQRVQALAEEKQAIYRENALEQAAQGVERKLGGIADAVSSFAYSGEVQALLRAPYPSGELFSAHSAVQALAATVEEINPDIVGIAILPRDGSAPYYSFGLQEQYRYIQGLRAELDAGQDKTGAFSYLQTSEPERFTFALPVFSTTQSASADLSEYLGTVLAFCDASALREVLAAAALPEGSIELRSGAESLLLVGRTQGNEALAYETANVPAAGWVLVQRTRGRAADVPYAALFVMASALGLAVLVLLSYVVHRNFTAPITRIAQGLLRLAEQPQRAEPLRVRCGNELRTIAASVNVLLRALREAQKVQAEQEARVFRSQLAAERLQLALLQSQINPHFLYNTLACIRGRALFRGAPEIADIAANLSALYRYSIKGGESALLREELAVVRRYLAIQDARAEGRFRAQIDVPETLQALAVPKMILQPLVENAIQHGLEGRKGGGELRITAVCFPGDTAFLLRVWDNGGGIAPEKLALLRAALSANPAAAEKRGEESGHGVLLVHRKVRLCCGEPYGLQLESAPGAYTCAALLLPLRDARADT